MELSKQHNIETVTWLLFNVFTDCLQLEFNGEVMKISNMARKETWQSSRWQLYGAGASHISTDQETEMEMLVFK